MKFHVFKLFILDKKFLPLTRDYIYTSKVSKSIYNVKQMHSQRITRSTKQTRCIKEALIMLLL